MLDDLLKQVGDLLRDESDSKDGEQKGGKSVTVGNVGNNSTVVIVNGNNGPRRRKSDKPGADKSAQGRRGPDHDLHERNEALSYQVRCLERLVDHLLLKKDEGAFKRQLGGRAPRLISIGSKPRVPRLSQFKASRGRRARAAANSPQSPAVSGVYHLPPPNSIYYRLSQIMCPPTTRQLQNYPNG